MLTTGLVIGTFAAVPYVHLHLESRRRNYPHIPTLVHDDYSPKRSRLEELCKQYGCDFVSTEMRLQPTMGDLSAFVKGLEWAKTKGVDILVKMSRRFIPVVDCISGLQRLAYDSGHHTFSNISRTFDFGFRTECIGMRLRDWLQDATFSTLKADLEANREIFVEGQIHNVARELNRHNLQAERWDQIHRRPPEANAYAVWNFIGDDRCTRFDRFLWHDAYSPRDYADLAMLWNLPYIQEGFADPNEGGGDGRT